MEGIPVVSSDERHDEAEGTVLGCGREGGFVILSCALREAAGNVANLVFEAAVLLPRFPESGLGLDRFEFAPVDGCGFCDSGVAEGRPCSDAVVFLLLGCEPEQALGVVHAPGFLHARRDKEVVVGGEGTKGIISELLGLLLCTLLGQEGGGVALARG